MMILDGNKQYSLQQYIAERPEAVSVGGDFYRIDDVNALLEAKDRVIESLRMACDGWEQEARRLGSQRPIAE